MDGNTQIGGGAVANPGPSWKAVGTGDFYGDGESDILWQNTRRAKSRSGKWTGPPGSAAGRSPIPGRAGTPSEPSGGGSDILFQNTSGQTSIWEMDGTTQIGGGPLSPNPGPSWHAISLT